MTLTTPIWMQNATYPASTDRVLASTFWSHGVMEEDHLAVTEDSGGASMDIEIAAGQVIIEGTGTTAQGKYVCESTATETLTVSASPPSGQSRIDLVVATVRDSAVSGTNDDWILQMVEGSPTSSTPTPPTVPESSLVLAHVTVGAQVSSITNANIVDKRVRAGQLSQAARNTVTPKVPPAFNGQLLAVPFGILYVGTGDVWVRANPPIPTARYAATHTHTAKDFSWNQTNVVADVGSFSITAPGDPVTVILDASCTITGHTSHAAHIEAWANLQSGTTNVDGPHVLATSANYGESQQIQPTVTIEVDGNSTITGKLAFKTTVSNDWVDGSNLALRMLVLPR